MSSEKGLLISGSRKPWMFKRVSGFPQAPLSFIGICSPMKRVRIRLPRRPTGPSEKLSLRTKPCPQNKRTRLITSSSPTEFISRKKSMLIIVMPVLLPEPCRKVLKGKKPHPFQVGLLLCAGEAIFVVALVSSAFGVEGMAEKIPELSGEFYNI